VPPAPSRSGEGRSRWRWGFVAGLVEQRGELIAQTASGRGGVIGGVGCDLLPDSGSDVQRFAGIGKIHALEVGGVRLREIAPGGGEEGFGHRVLTVAKRAGPGRGIAAFLALDDMFGGDELLRALCGVGFDAAAVPTHTAGGKPIFAPVGLGRDQRSVGPIPVRCGASGGDVCAGCRGGLADPVGECLQSLFQPLAASLPVFGHHFPFDVGQGGQGLQVLIHGRHQGTQ